MTDIVQKLWGFCHTLRHDGVDYGDYIEQPTSPPSSTARFTDSWAQLWKGRAHTTQAVCSGWQLRGLQIDNKRSQRVGRVQRLVVRYVLQVEGHAVRRP